MHLDVCIDLSSDFACAMQRATNLLQLPGNEGGGRCARRPGGHATRAVLQTLGRNQPWPANIRLCASRLMVSVYRHVKGRTAINTVASVRSAMAMVEGGFRGARRHR